MLLHQPVNIAALLVLLGLVPVVVVLVTSFLKISIVLMLLRNALGIQQIPPNIAIYAFALILSGYIMAPALVASARLLEEYNAPLNSIGDLIAALSQAAEPVRQFLLNNTDVEQGDFFLSTAKRLWPQDLAAELEREHFIVLIPAFLLSELISAFQAGFLIYIPFLIIDLVVQSILLAMGMMMMSPMTISLPLKLLLFVTAGGWTKLVNALVLSYSTP